MRRAPLLNFEVPRGRVITEIPAEILFAAVPKMMVSDLIDIWVGGVGNINQLPVGEVGKKVPVGLPPLLCFVVASSGIWQKWGDWSGVVLVLWCVILVINKMTIL